jgi:hypothetical protein
MKASSSPLSRLTNAKELVYNMRSRRRKCFLSFLAFLPFAYLLLLIPDSPAPVPLAQNKEPFAWNRDEYWSSLESRFKEARTKDCIDLSSAVAGRLSQVDSLCEHLQTGLLSPAEPVFGEVETNFFELGVLLAACPSTISEYMNSFGRLRNALKGQSVYWDMNSKAGRNCIYRLLYGGRIAVEEAILQSPQGAVSQAIVEANEPSQTPSATILDVEIHSGDILVSRGGAPTSALIARGNDYPGNFSHVALLYVDESTNVVSIIESHIEKGVGLASVTDYLKRYQAAGDDLTSALGLAVVASGSDAAAQGRQVHVRTREAWAYSVRFCDGHTGRFKDVLFRSGIRSLQPLWDQTLGWTFQHFQHRSSSLAICFWCEELHHTRTIGS